MICHCQVKLPQRYIGFILESSVSKNPQVPERHHPHRNFENPPGPNEWFLSPFWLVKNLRWYRHCALLKLQKMGSTSQSTLFDKNVAKCQYLLQCGLNHSYLVSNWLGTSDPQYQWEFALLKFHEVPWRPCCPLHVPIKTAWWFQTMWIIFHNIYGIIHQPLTNSYFSRWFFNHQPAIKMWDFSHELPEAQGFVIGFAQPRRSGHSQGRTRGTWSKSGNGWGAQNALLNSLERWHKSSLFDAFKARLSSWASIFWLKDRAPPQKDRSW